MEREKIEQIYEVVADMTLKMLNMENGNSLYLSDSEIEMIRTTQSLYETVNCTNQPIVTIASESSVSDSDSKSQYGCNYTDRPDSM